MPQVIRIKRNTTTALAPTTLDPGELAYTKQGHKLFIGDDTNTVNNLVSVDRQLEIHANSPAQAIDPLAGAKTFPIAKLKVPGGNVGEFLSISAADGTLAYAPAVTSTQQFVGSLNAAAGTLAFTVQSGHPGPGLPAADPTNNGHYVIADTAGSVPPAGAPAGAYNIGDWVISNGVAWTHLSFGGIETDMASEIGVVAPVTGGSNVQEVLESLEAADATFVVGPAASVVGNIATYSTLLGHNIQDGGVALADLTTKTYVDAENDAQDLIIAANAAFVAAQPGVDAAQDALIDDKVAGPAAAVAVADNIAVWDGVTGRLIKDGGKPVPAVFGDVVGPATSVADSIAAYSDATGKLIKDGGILTTDIALKADLLPLGDVKGPASATTLNIAVFSGATGKLIADGGKPIPAVFGDVVGPAASTLDHIATYSDATGKVIKDSGLLASSLLTTIAVTAPELTGNGTAATPITFAGITTGVPVVGDPASFTGNGLVATPLALVLVDGGTYV